MRSLLAALLLAIPIAAHAETGGIQLDQAWSRATPAGRTGVVYLTIIDTGAPDTLTGVSTPVSAQAELHESFDDHGVMKMRAVAGLQVAPGKPVTLAPGGYHIMLFNLKQALQPGDSFPITLSFAKSGDVTTTATVAKAGASSPPMDHGAMGGMPMPSGNKP